VCSKGHQGSSVDRPCHLSFCGQFTACTESATSEYSITSQSLTALLGLAKENEVYPRRPQMEKKTSAHIVPIRPLPGDLAPLGEIKIESKRGGEEIHSMGRGGLAPGPPSENLPQRAALGIPRMQGLSWWVALANPPTVTPFLSFFLSFLVVSGRKGGSCNRRQKIKTFPIDPWVDDWLPPEGSMGDFRLNNVCGSKICHGGGKNPQKRIRVQGPPRKASPQEYTTRMGRRPTCPGGGRASVRFYGCHFTNDSLH